MKNQITSIYYSIVIEMRGGGKSFVYIPKSSSLLACLDEIPKRMTYLRRTVEGSVVLRFERERRREVRFERLVE